MEENKINELMENTVTKIREMVDTNTIVGKPIVTPDGITVIPVSQITFGFGTGGTSGSKGVSFTGGNGGGVKVNPIGFFVIKDGACRMISISPPASSTVDRVLEMAPDLLDKVDAMLTKHKSKE